MVKTIIGGMALVLVLFSGALRAEEIQLGAEIARVTGLLRYEKSKLAGEIERLLPLAAKSPELTCQLLLLRAAVHQASHDYAGVLEDAAAIAKTGEQLNYQKADDLALACYEANSFQSNSQIANEALEKHVQTFGENAHRLLGFRLRQVDVCIDVTHDFDTAGKVLETMRLKNPQMGKTVELREADLAVAKGDFADAVARSRKVLEARASQLTFAEGFAVRQRLGDLLLALKQYDEARAVYTKLIADVPGPLPRASTDKGPLMLSATEIANRKIAAGLSASVAATYQRTGDKVKALAAYRSILTTYPDLRDVCFAAQQAVFRLHYEAKEYDRALVAAVRLFDAAGSQQAISDAVASILQALHAIDGNFARGEQFLAYLKSASAAEPVQPKNPLGEYFGAATAVKPDAEEEALLQVALARYGETAQEHTARAVLNLYFGQPRAALTEFKQAFLDCAFETASLQHGADDVAVGLKAYYGHLGACAEFFEFQQYGAQGKDGKGHLQNVLKEF